eukprot:TRINITY_DN4181_c0_g2_i1.p1 TRINITY_DN4181_c0_g2~~TRINITY_DN4181_c0_g2_i1.p1  ORF type:complete len:314 (-),score=14.14 TRINITY_DN4181_c0_g2_i1:165-1106(-)
MELVVKWLRFFLFGVQFTEWLKVQDVTTLPTGTLLAVCSRPPIPFYHQGVIIRPEDNTETAGCLYQTQSQHPSSIVCHYNERGVLNIADATVDGFFQRWMKKLRLVSKSIVNLSTFEEFSGGQPVFYRLPPTSGDAGAYCARAERLLGRGEYNFMIENCQHLVTQILFDFQYSETLAEVTKFHFWVASFSFLGSYYSLEWSTYALLAYVSLQGLTLGRFKNNDGVAKLLSYGCVPFMALSPIRVPFWNTVLSFPWNAVLAAALVWPLRRGYTIPISFFFTLSTHFSDLQSFRALMLTEFLFHIVLCSRVSELR